MEINILQIWLFVIGMFLLFAVCAVLIMAGIGYCILKIVRRCELNRDLPIGRKCKGSGLPPKYAVLYFNRQHLKDGRYNNIDYTRVWFDIEGSTSQEEVLRSITEYFEKEKEVHRAND
jgi:hypothetical protein